MDKEELDFLTTIAKPWETINRELGHTYSVDPEVSDYTSGASGLAVTIKHFPEVTRNIKARSLINKSRAYEIISDLADSTKHRRLAKSTRECELRVGSMYERNDDAKFRFLRNVINIKHKKHGSIDFATCAMEASLFVVNELGLKIVWHPKVFNNAGEFSSKMDLHISRKNQLAWRGMQLQIVRLNEKGEYEPVEMNSTVEFTLTSEF